jgi:hypothetical protein
MSARECGFFEKVEFFFKHESIIVEALGEVV